MPEAKPRATFLSEGNKTDVTHTYAFLGSNLYLSYMYTCMNFTGCTLIG